MSENTQLLLMAGLCFLGGARLLFYSIRDGIVRRSLPVRGRSEPITGQKALVMGIVCSLVSLAFFFAVWLSVRQVVLQ